jgi:hypothetical protein
MSFNSTTKLFRLSYAHGAAATRPTELALSPQVNYPQGFHVTTTPSAAVRVTYNATADPYTVYIYPTAQAHDGQNITVVLQNASSAKPLVEANSPTRDEATWVFGWPDARRAEARADGEARPAA